MTTPQEAWRSAVKAREYQQTQIAREAVRSPLYRASTEERRIKLEGDLEEFMQRGGCIECVPRGVSGQIERYHMRSGGRPKRVT